MDFKRDPWPKVSEHAKDLVKKMLDPDPRRRLSAQEVLGKDLFNVENSHHDGFFLGIPGFKIENVKN